MFKNLLVTVVAGLVFAGAIVLGIHLSEKTVTPPPAGGGTGQDHYTAESFYASVTLGGNVLATTSQGSVTYTAASLREVSTIQHTASAALTATLPASSTLTSFAPRPGDVRTLYIAPITNGITLAGGTGTDLNTASSTKFCVVSQVCRLDFVRKSNSDFEVLLTNSSGI